MKKTTRILALVLSMVMLLGLAACTDPADSNTTTVNNQNPEPTPSSSTPATTTTVAQPSYKEQVLACFAQLASASAPGLNTYESSWDEMVAYLTEKGVISAEAQQVDMLTTEGYLNDNTGGSIPTYAFADKAVDFGGFYLVWWDLVNPSAAHDCYVGMKNNSGNIVIMGGAAVVKFVMESYGSFAIGFSAEYDEAAKNAAIAAMDAVDGTAYNLNYMSGATGLAEALLKAGLLTVNDAKDKVNLNEQYSFPSHGWVWDGDTSSWVEKDYDAHVTMADEACTYGNVTILYFAAANRSETSYYPNIYNVYKNLSETGTSNLYCYLNGGSELVTYTANAENAYDAAGTEVTVSADAVYGGFAIYVAE